MTRKITVNGGPIDGKTVIVHDTQETFTHHADQSGVYKVNEKTATWKPHTAPAPAEQADKPAPKPTRKATVKPTAKPTDEQPEPRPE